VIGVTFVSLAAARAFRAAGTGVPHPPCRRSVREDSAPMFRKSESTAGRVNV